MARRLPNRRRSVMAAGGGPAPQRRQEWKPPASTLPVGPQRQRHEEADNLDDEPSESSYPPKTKDEPPQRRNHKQLKDVDADRYPRMLRSPSSPNESPPKNE